MTMSTVQLVVVAVAVILSPLPATAQNSSISGDGLGSSTSGVVRSGRDLGAGDATISGGQLGVGATPGLGGNVGVIQRERESRPLGAPNCSLGYAPGLGLSRQDYEAACPRQ